MDVKNQSYGKVITAAYQHYITLADVEDKYKPILTTITIPSWEGIDQYQEIDQAEAERIKSVKNAAKGSVEYPEQEVNQMIGLLSVSINDMKLTDEQSYKFKNLYPKWSEFIGEKLSANFKIQHLEKLYKTLQEIPVVLDQEGYRPGEVGSEALYEEVNEKNKGTLQDPIPYNNNMELFEGKYYSQNGVTYKCTRNTEQAVYQDLSDLVGIYVEQAS
jgi:hypothetical protein